MRYDDQEMNKIYQESIHPKDYTEDSKYGKYQKQPKKPNLFKQDIHANVSRYSTNKKTSSNQEIDKTMIGVMKIIGLIILTLIFILLPILTNK